ncbi:cobalt transporter CbiM [Methanolobus halotolerans]|uniref:Cobalamin biosynthesis protein CbiM n=1 Tax=Methanolobus halotolerans TaxID=2052935 RepID=A0A4E0PUU6_9EURY|nr:cobalt transporter CbiM [Methanolobus halotolerans]TGC07282.1 cobalamin biosynthesis protein CbiM [Methanolobus halotolerans]
MHISDGVLSFSVVAAGWAITLVLSALILWRCKYKYDMAEQIPKISIITGTFFVASLIHISIGPTSVHLLLNGLMGVVLGVFAFPAMLVGLTLQAFLFQHGGITTIGANNVIIGIPALISYWTFRFGYRKGINVAFMGALCGALGILLSGIFLAFILISTGEEFREVAYAALIAHLPVMVIEGIITGSVVSFLLKVRPELLPVDTEV